jgi:hypothetical protein
LSLPSPAFSGPQLIGGRIVLYLDQNLWSRVAAARHGHRPVQPDEAAAAETLAQLVDDRRVIVPVSAGHFLETARYEGPSRLGLAGTLLELCRGWQMRHPGVVGVSELIHAVSDQPAITRSEIFTLQPNATFLRPFAAPKPRYPEPFGSMISNVIAATATYDAMVDPSALTDEGAEVRQRWAAAQDALVELFAKDEASKERVHRAALGRLLVDYAGDELQNGRRIDLHAIQSWLPRATNDVTEMPYLGRLWRPDVRTPAERRTVVRQRPRRHLQPVGGCRIRRCRRWRKTHNRRSSIGETCDNRRPIGDKSGGGHRCCRADAR